METKKTDIHIVCDGVELDLVPYISDLFSTTITAMVETLKGGENAKEIVVSISKKADSGFHPRRTLA